jgi:hypothetical protein
LHEESDGGNGYIQLCISFVAQHYRMPDVSHKPTVPGGARQEAGTSKGAALSELFAESKVSRCPVGPPDTEWARAYERSFLRSWARFPVDGEVYETLEDMPIKFLTHWRAPFTGDGEGTLPKGTRVRVEVLNWIREPIGVYAKPVDVPRIERLLVSDDDRANAKYGGFSLSISTADLNRRFRLVECEPD